MYLMRLGAEIFLDIRRFTNKNYYYYISVQHTWSYSLGRSRGALLGAMEWTCLVAYTCWPGATSDRACFWYGPPAIQSWMGRLKGKYHIRSHDMSTTIDDRQSDSINKIHYYKCSEKQHTSDVFTPFSKRGQLVIMSFMNTKTQSNKKWQNSRCTNCIR